MKKLLLTLILLLPAAWACNFSKPAEVEMQLPTPTAAPTVAMSPTVLSDTPQPTATETPTLEYSIEDIKGTGLIIPDGSAVPESAAEGEAVEAGDELKTEDNSEMTLALNNDTMIHISADSDVKVADLTPNDTNGFTSRMELILGNILSEVEKLNESKSSFEIEAGGVVCAVRGTAFEVQKQGDNISTSTFHGVVEMQKDGAVQKVNANEHSTFSLHKSGFLPQRVLKPSEKRHYQVWVKKKAMVQKKRAARLAAGRTTAKPVKEVEREKPKAARATQLRAKEKKTAVHQARQKARIKRQTQNRPKARPRPARQRIKSAARRPVRRPQNQPRKQARPKKKRINN